MMVRNPSVDPCSRARRGAIASILPRTAWWLMSLSASEAMCCLGMIMKCTGASGWMSWKAKMSSSSYTFLLGISPRTILRKTQFSIPQPLLSLGLAAEHLGARRLLVETRDAFAPLQLGKHVARPQAVLREHDEAVEPQVGRFGDDAALVAVLRRHHRLGRFLADFLQDRVGSAREQPRDVGLVRVAAFAALDDVRQPLEYVAHRP